MLEGGCLCGAIRYRAEGEPFHRTNCHCSICQRASAAPYVAWFSVFLTDFHWLGAEPAWYQSTAEARRGFCPRCGTQLSFRHRDFPDEIDLTTCSLDRPEAAAPQDQTFTASKLSWVALDDSLPTYPGRRDE
jgi:hypothetical protein